MRESPRPQDLLDWYDVHARVLPWRVPPSARKAGVLPDPYHVWLSEVMLQQTTVAAVKGYFTSFATRWPTVRDLAKAPDAEVMAAWAGLGYYARARNLLRCARTVAQDHGGAFPATQEELQNLPGIVRLAAIAFDVPAAVMDGNVERVIARLFDDPTPLPAAKSAFAARAATMTPSHRPGDYAQAIMDLGATICTPRSPACGICPWAAPCRARAAGTAAELPKKSPRKAKAVRRGIAYVARRDDGAWLLETRPQSGLLGGMLGWPGSDWSDTPDPAPPCAADWQLLPGEVRHTFTHFHLILEVRMARLPDDTQPEAGRFVPAHRFRPADLPTLMRKVFDLARSTLS